MNEFRRLEAKGLARAKLRAKRRRVRAIRARTVVGSVALFALAWAIVFGQLVTGNDPVLNRPGRSVGRPVAAVHRESHAQAARPEPEAAQSEVAELEAEELEAEAEAIEAEEIEAEEVEAAPEEIEAAPEPEEPAPEPAPVITSAS